MPNFIRRPNGLRLANTFRCLGSRLKNYVPASNKRALVHVGQMNALLKKMHETLRASYDMSEKRKLIHLEFCWHTSIFSQKKTGHA
jgi:hypothetical protein